MHCHWYNSHRFFSSEPFFLLDTGLRPVHNCLARVVTRSSGLSESRPLLKSLHWLPIKSRSKCKLNLLTYKALFIWFIEFRETPANTEIRKYEVITSWTVVKKRNYCHSLFVVAAPRFWYKLPLEIHEAKSVTIFRKITKTHFLNITPNTLVWTFTDCHMTNSSSDYDILTEYWFLSTAPSSLNFGKRYWRYRSILILISLFLTWSEVIIGPFGLAKKQHAQTNFGLCQRMWLI